jgi:hypothetical protein
MRRATTTRRFALSLAVLALSATVLLPATTSSGAAGTISVVDYSQCANGTGTAVACDGWINGILQKSNSHFKEGDVTPQRAIVTVSGNGPHSITLKYQARKGTTHAYDSLATWNTTVVDADRCLGLTAAVQTALDCSGTPTPSSFTITADPTVVQPFTALSGATSAHDLDGQLKMYGGVLTGMTEPTHDHALCSSKCADDYATTTISFTATAGSTVELLFGGHLAVSPLNRGGWGPGLGASNISGGPYHIKWAAADGASVGNRDNQIMGDAIQALAEPGISTQASPTSATIGTAVVLTDTVTLAGATDPSGTTSFSLWGPYDTAAGATCDSSTETAVLTASTSTYAKTGGGTGLGTWTGTGTATSTTFGADSDGLYYWTASTASDANNAAAGPEGCGDSTEQVTVSKATPGGSTAILLDDSVSVTGDGTNTPGGSATFSLYQDDATCAVAANLVSGPTEVSLDSSGNASTTSDVVTESGSSYYWLVTYSGDGIYAPGTISACAEVAVIT